MFEFGNLQCRPSVEPYERPKNRDHVFRFTASLSVGLTQGELRSVVLPILRDGPGVAVSPAVTAAELRSVVQTLSRGVSAVACGPAVVAAELRVSLQSDTAAVGPVAATQSLLSAALVNNGHATQPEPPTITLAPSLASASLA